MIDKERNTQIVLSKEDNRKLRMMAASEGTSAKQFVSRLIQDRWLYSPLSMVEAHDGKEEIQAATAAHA